MTFRTVVRDGLIVINTHGELPDGTPVEVVRTPSAESNNTRTVKKRSKSARGASKPAGGVSDPIEALAGIWKDRPDWKGKTTSQIAAELREKSLGRRPRG